MRSTIPAVGRAPARRQDPARQDVERRLANYFNGFGLTDPQRLDRLIGDVLARVPVRRAAGDPAATVLAGRAAFLLCDGRTRWQGAFLRRRPPKAFVAALRRAAVEPTPPPEPCVMAPQELEFWSPANLLRPWLARPARLAYGLLPGLMHGRWLL